MRSSRTDTTAPGATTPSRRRFLGYLLAAPTLVAAAELGGGSLLGPAAAAATGAGVPPTPQVADHVDLTDGLVYAARPTANLISVQLNEDGSATFALNRTEVGQGLSTAIAMLIA